MTCAITRPGIRQGSLLAGLVWIVFGLLASCGGGGKFELTLRVRDSDGWSPETSCALDGVAYEFSEALNSPVFKCVVSFERRDWVGADGRRATVPPHTEITYLPQHEFDNIECGGRQLIQRWWLKTRPELPAGDASFVLQIDDGNSLNLTRDVGLWVASGSTGVVDCFEGSGHWTGTAGDLLDRTGTFTILNDSVQTVLRLVED